jgi:hypothetical protein
MSKISWLSASSIRRRKSSISLKSPQATKDADSHTPGLMTRKMHKVIKAANEFKSQSWYQKSLYYFILLLTWFFFQYCRTLHSNSLIATLHA